MPNTNSSFGSSIRTKDATNKQSTSIFLSNLPSDITDNDIRRLYPRAFNVKRITDKSGEYFYRIATVTFNSASEAIVAAKNTVFRYREYEVEVSLREY